MEQFVVKGQKTLRCGYTTGSCAAGAAAAATQLLLTGKSPLQIHLPTPKGITLTLEIEDAHRVGDTACCAVRKDSGDDPDVTHGIRIYAAVSRTSEAGIHIDGGAGVGRVTRVGLSCPVGTAAINPRPRAQIIQAVQRMASKYGSERGFSVVISAEGGEEIAKRTFNPRLGIVGGISILGTSGIVEPMSEQALVDTIRVEMDSHFAAGERHLLACPGNYGQDFAQNALGIDLARAVTVSNFIGETLDYAVHKGFYSVLLIGHAGKLCKLAAGIMQTHSAYADGRQEIFAAHAALCGAGQDTVRQLMDSVTVDACIAILEEANLAAPVLASIGKQAEKRLSMRTHGALQTECILFTNAHGELFRSTGATDLLRRFQEK